MTGLNMHVDNIDICCPMEIKPTLTDNAVGKPKGLCKLSRQQRIRGGLRGLKTPQVMERVLDHPPVSVANITAKEHV